MFRVIKASTLDSSWLNGLNKLPFPDTVSDQDKKSIANQILSRVKLTNEDWQAIRNYGGVYIKNFDISDEQYEDSSYQGAVREGYFYDIDCDVIIPQMDGADRVEPVSIRYSRTYHRNTFGASNNSTLSSKELLDTIGQQKYEEVYKQSCMKTDDEIVNQYGDIDVEYRSGDTTAVEQEDGSLKITSQIYGTFTDESDRQKTVYAEVESIYDGSKITSKVTHFDDEIEWE